MLRSVITNKTKFSFRMIQDSNMHYLDRYKYKCKKLNRFVHQIYTLTCTLHSKIDNNRMIMRLIVYTENLTWNEASDKCEKIGGILPYFTSRGNFDHFIGYYRLLRPHELGHLESIHVFIGLKFALNEVGLNPNSK